jgi:hypothetical protein
MIFTRLLAQLGYFVFISLMKVGVRHKVAKLGETAAGRTRVGLGGSC